MIQSSADDSSPGKSLEVGPKNFPSMWSYTTGIEILAGTNANWTLNSYAICAAN